MGLAQSPAQRSHNEDEDSCQESFLSPALVGIQCRTKVRMSQQRLDADVLRAPELLLHPSDHDGEAGDGEGPGGQEEEAEDGRHGDTMKILREATFSCVQCEANPTNKDVIFVA